MDKWKIVLILVLAVVLLHILIIKIFIIGSNDVPASVKTAAASQVVENNTPPVPEPPLPKRSRRK